MESNIALRIHPRHKYVGRKLHPPPEMTYKQKQRALGAISGTTTSTEASVKRRQTRLIEFDFVLTSDFSPPPAQLEHRGLRPASPLGMSTDDHDNSWHLHSIQLEMATTSAPSSSSDNMTTTDWPELYGGMPAAAATTKRKQKETELLAKLAAILAPVGGHDDDDDDPDTPSSWTPGMPRHTWSGCVGEPLAPRRGKLTHDHHLCPHPDGREDRRED